MLYISHFVNNMYQHKRCLLLPSCAYAWCLDGCCFCWSSPLGSRIIFYFLQLKREFFQGVRGLFSMNVWSASMVLTELLTYSHISRIQNNGGFHFYYPTPIWPQISEKRMENKLWKNKLDWLVFQFGSDEIFGRACWSYGNSIIAPHE